MKKLFVAVATALLMTINANAQADAEGIRYSLPKTTLKISLLVEKTSFTPGELAGYSMLYMKQDAAKEPSTEYSIVGISLSVTVPKVLVVEPDDGLAKTEMTAQVSFFLPGIIA